MANTGMTQGELILILRDSWRAVTGGKLIDYAEVMGVSQKTLRNWVAEIQKPTLEQFARMQQIGHTDVVEIHIHNLTWGNDATHGVDNRETLAHVLGTTKRIAAGLRTDYRRHE